MLTAMMLAVTAKKVISLTSFLLSVVQSFAAESADFCPQLNNIVAFSGKKCKSTKMSEILMPFS
jgi:hypothetical protein